MEMFLVLRPLLRHPPRLRLRQQPAPLRKQQALLQRARSRLPLATLRERRVLLHRHPLLLVEQQVLMDNVEVRRTRSTIAI